MDKKERIAEFEKVYNPAKKRVISMFWLVIGLVLYSCLFRLQGNYRIIGILGIMVISYFWNREIIK